MGLEPGHDRKLSRRIRQLLLYFLFTCYITFLRFYIISFIETYLISIE